MVCLIVTETLDLQYVEIDYKNFTKVGFAPISAVSFLSTKVQINSQLVQASGLTCRCDKRSHVEI